MEIINTTQYNNLQHQQCGENGHNEYTWSNNISEKIVQLHFQLIRTSKHNILTAKTNEILTDLTELYRTELISYDFYIEHMSIMYRMIAYTRDIIYGKGEYSLAYMLLIVWNNHHPELSEFALRHFVLSPEDKPECCPYGSWKDIKYLYKYYNSHYSSNSNSNSLVKYGMSLLLEQLNKDTNTNTPSLASKWVPREKTQYGNMFDELAITYFSNYINSAKNAYSTHCATIKAKMDFRKMVSSLNQQIDTVQIKQCSNNWSNIDPTNQTSITMHKQKNAFLNIDIQGLKRSNLCDRVKCGHNFKEFAQRVVDGDVEVKGKRVGLNDFTKQAIQLCERNQEFSDAAKILNAQWVDNSKQNNSLGKIIAMVDVSASMDGPALHSAISLGIRVAENSLLGKRIMTFSARPCWVNLDGHCTFVDMVKKIYNSNRGMNANFESALQLILDAIISQKMHPDDVEDMVLAIFSDMQIDKAVDTNANSLYDGIRQKYTDAGIRVWGKPYKMPHILFWNLRSTSGFPTLSTTQNCWMMSGFSPVLLNLFYEEGLPSLRNCNPWNLLVKSLNNDRYNILDKYIRKIL